MHVLQHHLEAILSSYTGSLPLHHFLKNYFRQHPRLGSRDRRGLSDAAYAWYRCGKAFQHDAHPDALKRLAALQFCGLHPKAFQQLFPTDWPANNATLPPDFQPKPEQIFTYPIAFSAGITADEWRHALLRQPRLFLRIRSPQEEVEARLQAAAIPYEWIAEQCLALPNTTRVDDLLPPDAFVVQDASSQACGAFLQGAAAAQWWDCCSGAGGKSLMLAEQSPGIRLLCTDLRPAILQNLKERFRRYQLPQPECRVLDASNAAAIEAVLGTRRFDGIICDVPCSGSGTWARTPENCYFFQPESLTDFAKRQQAILHNAAGRLAPEGRLVYITCSVFRAENEAVVEAVAEDAGLHIESMQLINGLAIAADSLFVAVLRRN